MKEIITKEEIYDTCEIELNNDVLNTLIFYFYEYRNQREEFATAFKEKFCSLVDNLKAEMIEQEEEEE